MFKEITVWLSQTINDNYKNNDVKYNGKAWLRYKKRIFSNTFNSCQWDRIHRLHILFFYLPFSDCNVLEKHRKYKEKKHHKSYIIVILFTSGVFLFRYTSLKIKFGSYFINGFLYFFS